LQTGARGRGKRRRRGRRSRGEGRARSRSGDGREQQHPPPQRNRTGVLTTMMAPKGRPTAPSHSQRLLPAKGSYGGGRRQRQAGAGKAPSCSSFACGGPGCRRERFSKLEEQ
jgi:hypothetical protein